MRSKPAITLAHAPPTHGWLTLTVTVNGTVVEIDASDVPNNPIEDLLAGLELAANGGAARIWWHLEPDGYFMCFTPCGNEIHFELEFAAESRVSRAKKNVEIKGSAAQILLPFWRFVREFQSHGYVEPHWPSTDYSRIDVVKKRILQVT